MPPQIFLLFCVLSLALTGPGSRALAQGPDGPTAATVVVTVDETPITLGEIIALRSSLPEEYQALPDEVLMETLVLQLTDQQLLANAAVANGLASQRPVLLALKNLRRKILAEAYMNAALAERVDDAAIRAAYEDRFANAEPVLEIRAAHILVGNEMQAAELKQKLDDGVDFAALAAEFGTDGTAALGGELGWIARETVLPEFADAVFALEPGVVSEPIKTALGWHVIRVDAVRDRPVPALSDVRAQIAEDLTRAARQAILEQARNAGKATRPEEALPHASVRQDALVAP